MVCSEITNCDISIINGECEKCIPENGDIGYSFLRDLNYNNIEYPNYINK